MAHFKLSGIVSADETKDYEASQHWTEQPARDSVLEFDIE